MAALCDVFFDQVRQHFAYLITVLGFRVVAEQDLGGNCNAEVIFESPLCRLKVLRDSSQVVLSASPINPPDRWVDVGLLIGCMTYGSERWNYEIPDGDIDDSTDLQLARAAAHLKRHIVALCEFVSPDKYWDSMDRLARWQREYH